MTQSGRTPAIAKRLVDAYITGLRQRLPTRCTRQLDQLPGATEEQLLRLRQAYPSVPAELLYLLQRLNGTCWEAIAAVPPAPKTRSSSAAAAYVRNALAGSAATAARRERIAVPILGSVLSSRPYYLRSVEQMLMRDGPLPPQLASAPRQPVSEDSALPWQERVAANAQSSTPAPGSASSAPNTSSAARPEPGPCDASADTIALAYRDCVIRPEMTPPAAAAAKTTPAKEVKVLLHSSWTPAAPQDAADSRRVVVVDPRVNLSAPFSQWLAFADCMNPHHPHLTLSAASSPAVAKESLRESAAVSPSPAHKSSSASRLYIDFNPSELHGGSCGQIILYERHPESFRVIAKDFGAYIKLLMSEEYEFTEELEDDDVDDDAKGRNYVKLDAGAK